MLIINYSITNHLISMKKHFYLILITLILTPLLGFKFAPDNKLNRKLRKYVRTLPEEFDQIPDERKTALTDIGDYITEEQIQDGTAVLLFICTHNSRRSQMGQVWMETAAAYYGVKGISASSGGTEGTAFNPRAVAALERAGFGMSKNATGSMKDNPQYLVHMGAKLPTIITYSKRYSNPFNPQSDFAALMVCSQADRSCPVVDGADARFSLPYDDPRYYDDTPSEGLKYDERCRQIAREVFFLVSYVKEQNILMAERDR